MRARCQAHHQGARPASAATVPGRVHRECLHREVLLYIHFLAGVAELVTQNTQTGSGQCTWCSASTRPRGVCHWSRITATAGISLPELGPGGPSISISRSPACALAGAHSPGSIASQRKQLILRGCVQMNRDVPGVHLSVEAARGLGPFSHRCVPSMCNSARLWLASQQKFVDDPEKASDMLETCKKRNWCSDANFVKKLYLPTSTYSSVSVYVTHAGEMGEHSNSDDLKVVR